MPDKYIIQRRTASGLETVAELPALENSKVDMSWLPVVGAMGSAIIERGSNANGEYIRWADGTQVCISPQLTITAGGMTQTYTSTSTHAAAFIEAPTSVISTLGTNSGNVSAIGAFYMNGPYVQALTTYTTIKLYSYREALTTDVYVKLLTIGRWK